MVTLVIVKNPFSPQDGREVKYIEAAVAAEIYRLILNGEYREKNLNGLTVENLLCDHPAKNKNTYHAKEWNALLAMMHQKDADVINRATVRSYFNLIQGSAAGSVVVLDAINLSKTIRKVKTVKLQLPIEEIQSDDKVKLRKDTYSFFADITSRVDNVAKAELAIAKKWIQPIYECFDDDDIEEEDIEVLLSTISSFYKEVDNAQINILSVSVDDVKRTIKQIVKAIKDINRALDEDDSLTVLMAFSGDPIASIQPLVALINRVSNDIKEAEKQINAKMSPLRSFGFEEDRRNLYKAEIATIDNDITLLEVLR